MLQNFEMALQDANKCIELKPTWGKVGLRIDSVQIQMHCSAYPSRYC